MAKTQTATCIDSSGIERQYKQSWLDKQRALGKCFLGSDGVYRYPQHAQQNDGAGSVSSLAVHRNRAISLPPIQLRPNEPTPVSSGDFLPYPMAHSGRSLRAKYPAIAQAGAGL